MFTLEYYYGVKLFQSKQFDLELIQKKTPSLKNHIK